MRRLLPVPAATLAATLAAGAADGVVSGAAAQPLDLPGGPIFTATISQSATIDTNYRLDDPSPGTSYYADTRLLLGYVDETPDRVFALGLDTGLRALWEAKEDFEFTVASPSTATLDYDQEWANAALESYLRFRSRDIDATALEVVPDDDPLVPDDIREVDRDITEQRYDGGFTLDLATDAPSSYQINVEATRFDYSGDDADTRSPRTTVAGDVLWRLQLTPVLSGALGAGYSWYEADNNQETRIQESEVDAGLIYDPSAVLQLRFGVGWATYKREQRPNLGGGAFGPRRTVDDDKGYVLRGAVRYLFEDVTLNAEARLTNAAPETRLSGSVRASYPLPRGAVTGRLFQRYGGGDQGEEIRVTGAGIGIEHEINTVSRLGFDVNAARQENLDTNEPDTDRMNFSAVYTRDLTEVVSASLGYRYRLLDEEPNRASGNIFFVEIGRSFATGP